MIMTCLQKSSDLYCFLRCLSRLRYLSDVMPKNCFLLISSPETIRRLLREADTVIGSVLIPGAKAPKLVTRDMRNS